MDWTGGKATWSFGFDCAVLFISELDRWDLVCSWCLLVSLAILFAWCTSRDRSPPHLLRPNTSPLSPPQHTYVPNPSEAIPAMANPIEFPPAIPSPAVFDVQKRIRELYGYLDPHNPQHGLRS